MYNPNISKLQEGDRGKHENCCKTSQEKSTQSKLKWLVLVKVDLNLSLKSFPKKYLWSAVKNMICPIFIHGPQKSVFFNGRNFDTA